MHVLGEAAPWCGCRFTGDEAVYVAVGAQSRALRHVQAVPAFAADGGARCRRDAVANSDWATDDGHLVGRLRAHLLDGSDQFMAGDDGELQSHVAGKHVLVRATDSCAFHLQKDFVVADLRPGKVVKFDRPRLGHDGGLDGAHR